LGLHLGNELVVFPNLPVDFLAMVVIIGKRRVHIGQRKLREIGHDLVWRLALLGPEHDILDTNPLAGDPGSTAADTGRDLDMSFV